jgi:hypothetical protein
MSEKLASTLGLTQLAQAWSRRLGHADHDALVVTQGPTELLGSRFPLLREAGRIVITRGEPGPPAGPHTIRLPSAYVSAPHAALEATASGWRVVDLGSNNRTYVGTVKVSCQDLVYGDEIRLGDVVLVYVTAERSALPAHAVDQPSGLLAARVIVAEATRLLAGGERPGLLLLRIEGLREQLASPGSDAGALVRTAGGRLLELWADDVLVGRLEADLVLVAWGAAPADLRAEGQRTRDALSVLLSPHGLRVRGVVLSGARHLPRVLACALAAIQRAGEEVLEAELAAGELPADSALLRALAARPDLPLLVVALEDEDQLRHHLGHDGLAACRWQLRRIVARQEAPLSGVLDDRLFVVGLSAPADAEPVADRLREELRRELPGPGLRTTLSVEVRPTRLDDLRRALSRAVESNEELGPREPVEPLPTPVAAPYSLVWVVASNTARVKAILDCADVLTRFVAAATLSALAGGSAGEELRRQLRRRRRRRLPLGEWVALLRVLAPALKEGADPVAEVLRRALGVDRRGVRLAALLERELLPRRNRFAHGEGAPRAGELLPELNELIRQLAPLSELQLSTVLESSPRRGGGTRATLRVHTGPRENFEVRQVDLRHPGPVFVGSSYLVTLDYRELLELSPLVHFGLCPRCDRQELFVAEGLPGPAGDALELSAVSTGHRLRWTPTADDLPGGLLALLGDEEP